MTEETITIKKHTLKISFALILLTTFIRCSLPESFDKFQQEVSKTTKLIEAHTDCHEVSLLNYQITNGVKKEITYKLVGCEYEDLQIEADKIKEMLRDSIDGFCKAKKLNLIFKSKEENKTIQYWKCEPTNF